jgi:hypothetical protein
VITVYFNCDDYISKYKNQFICSIHKWVKIAPLFFPAIFGPAELSGNGLHASFPCKINTVFVGYTQISLPTGCKVFIHIIQSSYMFRQDVWPESVGALCTIYCK